MDMKVFESSEGNVFKYVFTGADFVVESVLYRYENFMKRTVICCSTQSGCPVGCKFCGTGNKFIRNLTADEIVCQIYSVLNHQDIRNEINDAERFQIMFMSMGEPMLNWDAVESAIRELHEEFPKAELLLSTIAPNTHEAYGRLIQLSKEIDKVGLQFSIHKSNNEDRDKLIPYEDKLSLQQIRDLGILWWKETGRHPYLNYCIDGTNNYLHDAVNLNNLFSPVIFNFTFSVVCSSNENMKEAGFKNLDSIRQFERIFSEGGYNTRIFDPAGQDDIGGGCGQLWYVQQWMKEHENNYTRNNHVKNMHIVIFTTPNQHRKVFDYVLLGLFDHDINGKTKHNRHVINIEEKDICIDIRYGDMDKCGGIRPDYVVFAGCSASFKSQWEYNMVGRYKEIPNLDEMIEMIVKEGSDER